MTYTKIVENHKTIGFEFICTPKEFNKYSLSSFFQSQIIYLLSTK